MAKTAIKLDYSLWKMKVDLLNTQLMPFAKVTARQVGLIALEMIKDRTPSTESGTDIRSLWKMSESKKVTETSFIISNTYQPAEVIMFFEVGTRPHIIKARGNYALHFWWLGREIYARKVRHPGTPAYRMIGQTEDYIRPKMDWWERQQMSLLNKIMSKRGKI